MIKEWFTKIFGETISLREKLFRIIISMGIAAMTLAIISNVALKQSLYILMPLVIGLFILLLAFWISCRYNNMELAATIVVSVVDWIMFPIIYFTSGGIESGATVWFVLGIIFVFLLFNGKRLIAVLTVTLCVLLTTYIYGYHHPEAIMPMASARDVAFDSALAVFMVSIAIGVIIKFQSRVFNKESAITQQQKKELEEINRSKSSFFTNMSHEIRTPINTIIGLNEMTLREELPDEIVENSLNIQNASKILLSLINDILDLSKIESGKMEIVPTQYETGTMFSELINIIWIRTIEKKLEFKLDVDKNIPSMLYGDEVRLRQVLLNLLTNSVKYTGEGSVTLSAFFEKKAPNEGELKISVTDTGMGIRKESMEDLFSSFKRVDEKKNKNIEGTGLGLSISKQLITLMGGKIEVDSIYTKGSTFTVTVPQKIVDEKPVGVMNTFMKKKLSDYNRYKQSFEAPDARVLVVDDNEMNRLVATKLLRATKVQVDTAESGKECLEKTKEKQYHVIFMDHKMPKMDGVETLQRVRNQENGRCKKTPVVALTANVLSGAEQIYEDYGFDGYLAKPINGMLFEATLLKYLPEELIEYSETAQETLGNGIQMVKRKRKKPVYITADCVCDIPQQYMKEYEIGIVPYYVLTNEGKFRDMEEIQTDSLLDYIAEEEHHAYSHAPSEEEYESFYADALEMGEKVIHITISKDVPGGGYAAATAAMRGFNHVTVYDSTHLSSGMGIMVLTAAKMAKEHKSVEDIIDALNQMKERISMSFIVPTIQRLYQNGLTGKFSMEICKLAGVHPILHMSHGRMRCKTLVMGEGDSFYRKYIHKMLRKRKNIDTRVVFITYAGCNLHQLQEFTKEVKKRIEFEHVIYQQASATIASNCGPGAMGVIFLKKN